jgi:hypothetical protein
VDHVPGLPGEILLRRIRADGVAAYPGPVRYVRAAAELREHGADAVVAGLAALLDSP